MSNTENDPQGPMPPGPSHDVIEMVIENEKARVRAAWSTPEQQERAAEMIRRGGGDPDKYRDEDGLIVVVPSDEDLEDLVKEELEGR